MRVLHVTKSLFYGCRTQSGELNRAYTALDRVERGPVSGDLKNWVAFASSAYRNGLADYNAKNYDSARKHATIAGEVADAIDHYTMRQKTGAAAKLPAPPAR